MCSGRRRGNCRKRGNLVERAVFCQARNLVVDLASPSLYAAQEGPIRLTVDARSAKAGLRQRLAAEVLRLCAAIRDSFAQNLSPGHAKGASVTRTRWNPLNASRSV